MKAPRPDALKRVEQMAILLAIWAKGTGVRGLSTDRLERLCQHARRIERDVRKWRNLDSEETGRRIAREADEAGRKP